MNNISVKDELNDQYSWYCNNFLPVFQSGIDEFFSEMFSIKLVSVSRNINVLFQGDEYFVTKIRVDKFHDIFFRCSTEGVKIILDNILGERKKFVLSDITELEAKILTSFNDYLYNKSFNKYLKLDPNTPRKNFDTINLTFFVKEKTASSCGKLVVSVPLDMVNPQLIQSQHNYNVTSFNLTQIPVNIKIGSTIFLLKDLKALEKDDIVIFEDSNINKMRLVYKNYETDFNITPNPGLVTPMNDDDGGNNMEQNPMSQDLWDNIQVEMGAEFDKVKISLGELKSIEQGLVVDIASVYNNKVSLVVENRTIAKGELVIINDRYGVRIDEVFAAQPQVVTASEPPIQNQEFEQNQEFDSQQDIQEQQPTEPQNVDGEFDYSDFDLDQEDI